MLAGNSKKKRNKITSSLLGLTIGLCGKGKLNSKFLLMRITKEASFQESHDQMKFCTFPEPNYVEKSKI